MGNLCYKLMWRKYRQTIMFKVRVFEVSTRGIREQQDKVLAQGSEEFRVNK